MPKRTKRDFEPSSCSSQEDGSDMSMTSTGKACLKNSNTAKKQKSDRECARTSRRIGLRSSKRVATTQKPATETASESVKSRIYQGASRKVKGTALQKMLSSGSKAELSLASSPSPIPSISRIRRTANRQEQKKALYSKINKAIGETKLRTSALIESNPQDDFTVPLCPHPAPVDLQDSKSDVESSTQNRSIEISNESIHRTSLTPPPSSRVLRSSSMSSVSGDVPLNFRPTGRQMLRSVGRPTTRRHDATPPPQRGRKRKLPCSRCILPKADCRCTKQELKHHDDLYGWETCSSVSRGTERGRPMTRKPRDKRIERGIASLPPPRIRSKKTRNISDVPCIRCKMLKTHCRCTRQQLSQYSEYARLHLQEPRALGAGFSVEERPENILSGRSDNVQEVLRGRPRGRVIRNPGTERGTASVPPPRGRGKPRNIMSQFARHGLINHSSCQLNSQPSHSRDLMWFPSNQNWSMFSPSENSVTPDHNRNESRSLPSRLDLSRMPAPSWLTDNSLRLDNKCREQLRSLHFGVSPSTSDYDHGHIEVRPSTSEQKARHRKTAEGDASTIQVHSIQPGSYPFPSLGVPLADEQLEGDLATITCAADLAIALQETQSNISRDCSSNPQAEENAQSSGSSSSRESLGDFLELPQLNVSEASYTPTIKNYFNDTTPALLEYDFIKRAPPNHITVLSHRIQENEDADSIFSNHSSSSSDTAVGSDTPWPICSATDPDSSGSSDGLATKAEPTIFPENVNISCGAYGGVRTNAGRGPAIIVTRGGFRGGVRGGLAHSIRTMPEVNTTDGKKEADTLVDQARIDGTGETVLHNHKKVVQNSSDESVNIAKPPDGRDTVRSSLSFRINYGGRLRGSGRGSTPAARSSNNVGPASENNNVYMSSPLPPKRGRGRPRRRGGMRGRGAGGGPPGPPSDHESSADDNNDELPLPQRGRGRGRPRGRPRGRRRRDSPSPPRSPPEVVPDPLQTPPPSPPPPASPGRGGDSPQPPDPPPDDDHESSDENSEDEPSDDSDSSWYPSDDTEDEDDDRQQPRQAVRPPRNQPVDIAARVPPNMAHVAFRYEAAPPSIARDPSALKKYQRARRKGLLFAMRGPPDPNVVKYCDAGAFDVECRGCKAIFWRNEAKRLSKRDGAFGPCCMKGKIEFPDFRLNPEFLEQLLSGTHPLSKIFFRGSHLYNERLALCADASKQLPYERAFPYVYRMMGALHLPISPAYEKLLYNPRRRSKHSPNHRWKGRRTSAQCRFVNSSRKAADIHLQNSPSIDYDLMLALEQCFRQHNGHFRDLLSMGELHNITRDEAEKAGIERPGDLVMVMDRADDPLVAVNEKGETVDALYEGEFCKIYNQEVRPSAPTLVVRQRGKPFNMPLASDWFFPFKFPLIFPYGDVLWHKRMKVAERYRTRAKNGVTLRAMTRCFLQRRRPLHNFHRVGKLAQLFMCYADARIEELQLKWYKNHQLELRCVPQDQLHERLNQVAEEHDARPGTVFTLPKNLRDTQTYYEGKLADQLTLVKKFGNADLFATFTASDLCPELNDKTMFPNNGSGNIDAKNRLLHYKMRELTHLIDNCYILGEVVHWFYTIEFQDRGGAHAHMLIWLKDKILTPDQVDSYVQCVIPPEDSPLFPLVTNFMMHTRCGPKCVKPGVPGCAKGFPQPYVEHTEMNTGNNRISYRRPNDGRRVVVKGVERTNRCVVPYNPGLLIWFGGHCCVEVVKGIYTIEYLLSYCLKGSGNAKFQVWQKRVPGYEPPQQQRVFPQSELRRRRRDLHRINYVFRNESVTANALDARPIIDFDPITTMTTMKVRTSSESAWNISFGTKYKSKKKVMRLYVHGEGQFWTFVRHNDFEGAARRETKDSMLEAFFKANQEPDSPSVDLLYEQMTDLYWFDCKEAVWKLRVGPSHQISRMSEIGPNRGDLFYLRLLLKNVRGATSFGDLRTVDEVESRTFKGACLLLNLLRDDSQYYDCMEEAVARHKQPTIRSLFALLLIMCELREPVEMFFNYAPYMIGDWVRYGMAEDTALQKLARYMARRLHHAGVVHLTEFTNDQNIDIDFEEAPQFRTPDEPRQEGPQILTDEELADGLARLNEKQRQVVEKVLDFERDFVAGGAVQPRTLFMEGCAGTGKTEVIMQVSAMVEARGGRVVRMAPTGMAANQICGRTAHSTLGLPLNMNQNSRSSLDKTQLRYHTLAQATLIIFDEVAVAPFYYAEVMHSVLCEMKEISVDSAIFAGYPVLLAGDFRQAGPIATFGWTMEQLHLRNWVRFSEVQVLSLEKNMRAKEQRAFAKWLKKLGEGSHDEAIPGQPGSVALPSEWMVRDREALIDTVFGPNLERVGAGRCIITMRNSVVNDINNQVLRRFPGNVEEFMSIDEFVDDNFTPRAPNIDQRQRPMYNEQLNQFLQCQMGVDFLNTRNPPGLPPHRLRLKKNCILMLLRNIDVQKGLVNGTRMRLVYASPNLLTCHVLAGSSSGQLVCIPRIVMTADATKNLSFTRTQFPVRLAFAATILKMQGQTMDFVGIVLEHHLFSHGLLYVGCSRVRNSESLSICMTGDTRQGYDEVSGRYYTQNTVNPQIWDVSQDRLPPTAPRPYLDVQYNDSDDDDNHHQGGGPGDDDDHMDDDFGPGGGLGPIEPPPANKEFDVLVQEVTGVSTADALALAKKRVDKTNKDVFTEEEAIIADHFLVLAQQAGRAVLPPRKRAPPQMAPALLGELTVLTPGVPTQRRPTPRLPASARQTLTSPQKSLSLYARMERLAERTVDGTSWDAAYTDDEASQLLAYFAEKPVFEENYMWRLCMVVINESDWGALSDDTASRLSDYFDRCPAVRSRYLRMRYRLNRHGNVAPPQDMEVDGEEELPGLLPDEEEDLRCAESRNPRQKVSFPTIRPIKRSATKVTTTATKPPPPTQSSVTPQQQSAANVDRQQENINDFWRLANRSIDGTSWGIYTEAERRVLMFMLGANREVAVQYFSQIQRAILANPNQQDMVPVDVRVRFHNFITHRDHIAFRNAYWKARDAIKAPRLPHLAPADFQSAAALTKDFRPARPRTPPRCTHRMPTSKQPSNGSTLKVQTRATIEPRPDTPPLPSFRRSSDSDSGSVSTPPRPSSEDRGSPIHFADYLGPEALEQTVENRRQTNLNNYYMLRRMAQTRPLDEDQREQIENYEVILGTHRLTHRRYELLRDGPNAANGASTSNVIPHERPMPPTSQFDLLTNRQLLLPRSNDEVPEHYMQRLLVARTRHLQLPVSAVNDMDIFGAANPGRLTILRRQLGVKK